MILLINAVPIATVLKEIYIKYRFKMGTKTNENIFVRFCARFRSFIVLKQTECYVFINYFFLIVYKRVPFSSVVTSSKLGSTAFTKASNHVWYASAMNLGSTPAVRQ